MNLGSFRSRVSSEIGLDNTAASAEQALIDGWMNEAVREFLLETKCYYLPLEMALTAGSGSYELTSDVLVFKNLYVVPVSGAQSVLLQPVDSAEIQRRRLYAAASPTSPSVYAVEGWNMLMLYPEPASSSDKLNGLYVPLPTEMSDAAHDPSNATYGGIPTIFHPTLLEYGKWKAAEWDDDTSSAVGEKYEQRWEKLVARARIAINRRAGVRLAPAVPKHRRTAYWPGPGVDTGT